MEMALVTDGNIIFSILIAVEDGALEISLATDGNIIFSSTAVLKLSYECTGLWLISVFSLSTKLCKLCLWSVIDKRIQAFTLATSWCTCQRSLLEIAYTFAGVTQDY